MLLVLDLLMYLSYCSRQPLLPIHCCALGKSIHRLLRLAEVVWSITLNVNVALIFGHFTLSLCCYAV